MFILIVVAVAVKAQSAHKVTGTYIYYAPENVSLADAKRTALDRARLQALADEFGTTLSQHNSTLMQNGINGSATNFTSLSSSDVKGEWIETIGKPEYEVAYNQGMLVVKCIVHGKAREIKGAKTDFSARILRNGTDDRNEDDSFLSGDDLFMSYQAPKDMYIAAYLIDASKEAYCLLPYRATSGGQVLAKGGDRHLYFSAKNDKCADEYTMTCGPDAETNYIYIITSPNPFTKANDTQADEKLPRQLSWDNFQKWLSKLRTHDKDMQVEVKTITVKPSGK